MNHHIDDGHKAITDLHNHLGDRSLVGANEAATRFQVIDKLLMDVLGWTKEDINVEDRVSEDGQTTFADYVLHTASTRVVVEAKKIGASFNLPSKRKSLLLGGVLKEGRIGEAIRQCRDYCRGLSVPFGVVTNGQSWVIFPAVRTDGIPFEDSYAQIFEDLSDIRTRFVEFWELLSQERVADGNLPVSLLGQSGRANTTRCVRQSVSDPGYRLGRNAVYEQIEPAVNVSLSDESLLEDPVALAACYVKTSERVTYDSRLRMHLADHRPPLDHKSIRVKRRKGERVLDESISRDASTKPPRFIVLLGPVGAGKTTFLHYTRLISSADQVNNKIAWINVDFKRATKSDDPRTFIYRELLQHIDDDRDFDLGDWETSIRPAYKKKIDDLRRGALYLLSKNDPTQFEIKISQIVESDRNDVWPYVENILLESARVRPGFLVIDNVDQIDSTETQSAVFLEAQAVARKIGFHVIMSLRESTYLQHRSSPAFDAFQFESLYIDPPSIGPVLTKRLSYAKHVLTGKSAEFTSAGGIRMRVPDLGKFFEIVTHSLLSEDAGHMLECLAGGDIRRAIQYVREFLSSGHTNADRALAAYLRDGEYHFPIHEVFKGAVLGHLRYFDDSISLLPNIFDSKLGSDSLQLARLRIVHYFVSRATSPGFEGEKVEAFRGEFASIGVGEADLYQCLSTLVDKRVMRTKDGLSLSAESVLLPTRLAAYILRSLSHEIAYIEFCAMDTVIFDDDSWRELHEITLEIEASHGVVAKMEQRSSRVTAFMEYVDRLDKRWVVEANRRGISGPISEEVVAPLSDEVREACSRAVQSARKNYGGGQLSRESHPIFTGEQTSGTYTDVWPDRDYCFIREDGGSEWYSHRTAHESEHDWNERRVGGRCTFRPGLWHGKPRAVAVSAAPNRR